MSPKIRVAILDDHQGIIDGYQYRLSGATDIEVVATALYGDEMVSMDEIERLATLGYGEMDKRLLTIDSALKQLPRVELTQYVVDYIREGQAVTVPHAPTSGLLRIYSEVNEFLGLGEVLDDGRVAPRRLINRGV